MWPQCWDLQGPRELEQRDLRNLNLGDLKKGPNGGVSPTPQKKSCEGSCRAWRCGVVESNLQHGSTGRRDVTQCIPRSVHQQCNQVGMQGTEHCGFQVQWSFLYLTTHRSTRDPPERGVGRRSGREMRGVESSLVKHGGKSIHRSCMPT
jgi:hypothetical protein